MVRFPLSRWVHLIVGFVAICCCAATLAQSSPSSKTQAGGRPKPTLFWIGDLDTNHDGRITREEASAAPAIIKAFDVIDSNHHGYITISDVQAYWARSILQAAQTSVAGRMAAFDRCDKQKTGKLKLEEIKPCMPRVAANFNVLDSKKHGYLTKEDVAAGAQLAAQQAIAQLRQRNAKAFANADANHDGKLSRVEFAAAFPRLASSFEFFDENRDGFIEPNEFALPPR